MWHPRDVILPTVPMSALVAHSAMSAQLTVTWHAATLLVLATQAKHNI